MLISSVCCKGLFRAPSSKLSGIMANLGVIVANNEKFENILNSMSHEVIAMRHEIMSRSKQILRAENAELAKQIEQAKQRLIALELLNDKKQIPVPGARFLCTDASQGTAPLPKNSTNVEKQQIQTANIEGTVSGGRPLKVKKPKAEKPIDSATTSATVSDDVHVGRLDLRVGKIVDVQKHPDADSLYLEKIDIGEDQHRTVVSGLVKFVPIEEMQNRMVVVLCNLKPAKMRGITSEAMVMCASTPEKVEVLLPPAGAVPGDLVHCEGYSRQPDSQLNPKKKIFELCAPDLMTNDALVACYKGTALHIPGKGNVVAQSLKNVNVK